VVDIIKLKKGLGIKWISYIAEKVELNNILILTYFRYHPIEITLHYKVFSYQKFCVLFVKFYKIYYHIAVVYDL
jgi:hypothetical protein